MEIHELPPNIQWKSSPGQATVHGANGESLTGPMQQETQLFHLQWTYFISMGI